MMEKEKIITKKWNQNSKAKAHEMQQRMQQLPGNKSLHSIIEANKASILFNLCYPAMCH